MAATPPMAGVSTLAVDKVSVAHVIDQGDSSEVAIPGQYKVAVWEHNYPVLKKRSRRNINM